ncbi:MAG: calycin-like domain-containing protein, partial [Prevotella sp.]|nr:calycin-like domain-containing protein [Prevotella sp.]
MKKIAAIVVFAFIALTAFANKYTDKLTVTVNGESMEQQTTIDVTKGDDGKYTLSLNNFCLESPNEDGTVIRLGVGNIILPDREGTTVDGVTTITYNDALLITEGNDAGIEGWMGPLLGPVPIEMVARFNDTQLYCEIHINLMDLLGQLIDVVFGSEPEAIAEVLTAPTIIKKEGVRNTLVIGVGTTSNDGETVATYYTTDGTDPSADNG